jgi:hypothetical protein
MHISTTQILICWLLIMAVVLQKPNASIQGYSGCTTATHIGTVRWKVEDDEGVHHDIILLNTYYSPKGKHSLVCPQYWAQVTNDHFPRPNGTWCGSYANHVTLYWQQQKYKWTVNLLPNTNVGVIYTAPGIGHYANTCDILEHKLTTLVMPTMINLKDQSEPDWQLYSTPSSEREFESEFVPKPSWVPKKNPSTINLIIFFYGKENRFWK